MNKPIIYAAIILLVTFGRLDAQIQFEQSFNYSGTFAQLENAGQKFFLMDLAARHCRIYNADYSLWKTVQLNVPNSQTLSDVRYVSQHLFNSDDQVEMVIIYYKYIATSSSYYYLYTTDVVNENGNVLLSVSGSSWAEVLPDASQGSKLLTWVYDYSTWPYAVQTRIYKIPGILMHIPDTETKSDDPLIGRVSVYPNPTNGDVTFKMEDGLLRNEAWLVISDESGKLCSKTILRAGSVEQNLNLVHLNPGTYYYEVISPWYRSKASRFIKIE